ncbi:MAG TPA: trypsin-like serine protease [Polyangiaceae bacterium]|nr:trypsin-like serine protease [Polyangiaceae bacterium]
MACTASPVEQIAVAGFEVIGGLVAPSPDLDHTGAIVRVDRETGDRYVLCTAALIGPETALTARHCAGRIALIGVLGEEVAWAMGGDTATARLIPVAATQVPEAGEEPGALGMGHDLAVIHLDEPAPTAPALPRPFDSRWSRASIVTLGYGMSSAWAVPDGLRRIGRETVVATSGLVYEALYGDFESYVEVELTGASTPEDHLARLEAEGGHEELGALSQAYAETRLIPDHEIVTRTLDGDTRGCRGDSGGPLLRVSPRGEWEVYGVLSGGPGSARAECDFGQVYSTLGPATFAFVESCLGWADPCGNVDARGACQGSVAQRCETHLAENERRLIQEDCGESGRACGTATGVARCVDAADP